jgi:HD-GYP domain-containing protein (c-di-GMP phosphodiesterase class II)
MNAADRIPLETVRDLLCIGQPLPFRVLDSNERLLLNEGHVLSDEAQFEALCERGAWAERPLVEAERAKAAAAKKGQAPAQAHPPSLFDRWERQLWQFDKLTRALVRNTAPAGAIPLFHEAIRELIDIDADVALFLCFRQADRRFALYSLTHSIHTCVVSVLTARQLGWSAEQVTSLGCAALTMNLALMELQATMAEQDTPPTTKQLEQIRAHPEASVKLLRASGIVDEEWLTTILQHHEQPGGQGYPAQLAQPTDAAQVLRAADVYTAKLSERAKRPAMTSQTAARELFQQRPGDALAMAMIKTLGIYPPGSLVLLKSGEAAVVVRRPASGTHPLVATLSERGGKPSLQTNRRNTAEPEFAVQGPLVDNKLFLRVLPERVYGFMTG